MSLVSVARDRTLGREVAVKALRPCMASQVSLERSRREIGSRSSLSTARRRSRRQPPAPRWKAATHAPLEAIVRGGARRTLEMPSFAKDISSDQVRLGQAFVLDQARQASVATGPMVAH